MSDPALQPPQIAGLSKVGTLLSPSRVPNLVSCQPSAKPPAARANVAWERKETATSALMDGRRIEGPACILKQRGRRQSKTHRLPSLVYPTAETTNRVSRIGNARSLPGRKRKNPPAFLPTGLGCHRSDELVGVSAAAVLVERFD